MIHLQVHQSRVHPGDVVRGGLQWQSDKAPKKLTVEMRWFTEGRGDVDSGRAGSLEWAPEQIGGIPPAVDFQFTVPPHGPVSYAGQLIRVRWAVTARLHLAWKSDPRHEVFLEVLPVPPPSEADASMPR